MPTSVPFHSPIRRHWPEYAMEAAELGIFLFAATLVTALVEHPASPVRQALPDPFCRRALVGLAMGATAIGIIRSPLGQQSGGHFNPSVTLTYLRLGKIAPADALCYVMAQFAGGLAGVLLAATLLGEAVAHPAVRYAVTVPGSSGVAAAFVAELGISFLTMLTILTLSNRRSLAHYTPLFAGGLVASYITLEAPLSGMSMNPARTLASALPAGSFMSLWVYFTAPVAGMLLAAEAYLRLGHARAVHCAKLDHDNHRRCIFRCGWNEE